MRTIETKLYTYDELSDRAKSAYFYVSVVDAGRRAAVLGPFDTYSDAQANVEIGRDLAERADPWAHFYAFGVVSVSSPISPIFSPCPTCGEVVRTRHSNHDCSRA